MAELLTGSKVTMSFSGLNALKEVDFEINKGEIAGLIGPNGAGKTTLFNVISGVYRPTSGRISFFGKNITGLKPHKICRMGVARTFQIVRPFLDMTTLENVLVGGMFGRSRSTSMSDVRKEALQYLDFVGILDKKDILARNLTINDRKLVEIATALNTNPQIVLLDEVVAGLNPTECISIMGLIRRIRDDFGVTVFWVEHVMKAVMEVAERVVVLHHGQKIADGTPKEMASNEAVINAYLGEKYVF